MGVQLNSLDGGVQTQPDGDGEGSLVQVPDVIVAPFRRRKRGGHVVVPPHDSRMASEQRNLCQFDGVRSLLLDFVGIANG